jgi:hypothetical protein
MSHPSDASDLTPQAAKKLAALISKEMQATGVTVLSGNEHTLSSEDKALVKWLNDNAARLHLHPVPVLFLYDSDSVNGSINAYSTVLSDGTPIVGISRTYRALMHTHLGTQFPSSPLERLEGAEGHEETHLKHRDSFKSANSRMGLKGINIELAADRGAVEATCNPQAREDALNILFLTQASKLGMPLQKFVEQQEADIFSDPWDAHPMLPTRIAHLEYMKEHPPRGCKKK